MKTQQEKKDFYLKKLKALESREIESCVIRSPDDIYNVVQSFGYEDQEVFFILTLDGAHKVIKRHEICRGLVNRTLVHPREVFRKAIFDNAAGVVLGHNHPSGVIEPSREDKDVTRRLKEAGEIIGIPVLDHVIIGKSGRYSFQENGF